MRLDIDIMQLRMARKCMGVHDLLKKADLPRGTYNNVISGKKVRVETIGKIAKGLGVDVTEIIED